MKNIKIEKMYVILGLIIILSLNYKTFYNSTSNTTKTTTETIETISSGEIKSSIEVTGSAELVNEQSLRFTQTGKIDKVNFKAGDKIKKGDIIATIDNTDGEVNVKQSKINLDNAKLTLNSLYEKKDESQYIQINNSIDNTKKSMNIAQKELDNLYSTKENGLNDINTNIKTLNKELESLQNNLDLSKKELDLSKTNLETYTIEQKNNLSNTVSNKTTAIKQIEDSLNGEMTNINKILEQVDYIIGVTDKNKSKNDYYQVYLSAKDTSFKISAETEFLESLNKYNETNKLVENYEKNQDIESIKNILAKIQELYKLLEKTTDSTYNAIDNSVVTSNFTQDEIDGKKSLIYSYKTSVQSKINTLNTYVNTLNTLSNIDIIDKNNQNTITQKENDISSKQESIKTIILNIEKKQNEINAQKTNYSTKEKEYDLSIESKKNNIENLEKTLTLNNQNLKELDDGPTNENILKAQNSIKQSEMSLETAKKSLEKYMLESPFDGVIRKIDYQVGDNLLSDSDKYVYIENPNMLQINIKLDQIDIIKVKIGDNAIVKFDGYPDDKINAKISNIDTTPIVTSGVVSYEVIVILDDDNFKKSILSGMTANIEIITNQQKNATLVSASAIKTTDDKSYLTIIKNGVKEKREISTGITYNGKTQILSGAVVGENIVIEDIIKTTETKTSSSLLQLGPSNNKNSSSNGNSSQRDMGGPPP